MTRRKRYYDKTIGALDENIRAIIETRSNETSVTRLKRILLKVINNELTPRQKEIIMLYYFKGLDTVTIARMYGVTPQAVSAMMSRARKRMYRIMKYCL